jgi:hypothetical protein
MDAPSPSSTHFANAKHVVARIGNDLSNDLDPLKQVSQLRRCCNPLVTIRWSLLVGTSQQALFAVTKTDHVQEVVFLYAF